MTLLCIINGIDIDHWNYEYTIEHAGKQCLQSGGCEVGNELGDDVSQFIQSPSSILL
jgi:hypothetical protein